MRNRTQSSLKVAVLSVLLIGTVSCGADVPSQTIDSAQSPQTMSTTDFTAVLVGEGNVNLQTELQKSPVALWFWAPG